MTAKVKVIELLEDIEITNPFLIESVSISNIKANRLPIRNPTIPKPIGTNSNSHSSSNASTCKDSETEMKMWQGIITFTNIFIES